LAKDNQRYLAPKQLPPE